jgi:hypothetical protein
MSNTLPINLWFASSNANKIVLLTMNGDHRDADSTRVLIAKITELEKVHEDILEA